MILGLFKDSLTRSVKGKGKGRQASESNSDTEDDDDDDDDDDGDDDIQVVEPDIGWVYVGSHNFTPSAWGTLSGSGFNPILNVSAGASCTLGWCLLGVC
jgi:tyrosyl-DNA phosphodiesterase-1